MSMPISHHNDLIPNLNGQRSGHKVNDPPLRYTEMSVAAALLDTPIYKSPDTFFLKLLVGESDAEMISI